MSERNRYSYTRDTFYLFNFQNDYHTCLCQTIIQSSGTNYSMFYKPYIKTDITLSLIILRLKMINGWIIFWIHQILNLVDLLICMETTLTKLLYKKMIIAILMLIPIIEDDDFVIDSCICHAATL